MMLLLTKITMINKQLNIKNAEGGNNGIPKGYSTLWQGGVRGRAEPCLRGSTTSKATLDGRLVVLCPSLTGVINKGEPYFRFALFVGQAEGSNADGP